MLWKTTKKDNQKLFKCEQCPKRFLFKSEVKLHSRSHNYLKCPECPKRFLKRTIFNAHMNNHAGSVAKLNNNSPRCDESITIENNLAHNKVTRNSTRAKKYHCPECNKTFYQIRHLKQHTTNYHGASEMFVCTFSGCGRKFLMTNNFHKHIKMHMNRERSLQVPGTVPDERAMSYFKVKDTNDESRSTDDFAYFDLKGCEVGTNEGKAKIKSSLLVEWKRWEIEQRKYAKRSLKIVGPSEIKKEDEEIMFENNNSCFTNGGEVESLDKFYNIEENIDKNKFIEILENVTVNNNDEDVSNMPDLADDGFHIISVGREDDNNPETEENHEKQRTNKGFESLDNNYDNSCDLPNTSNEESFSDALIRFVDNVMAQDKETQDPLFQRTERFHSPPISGEAEKSLGGYYYNVLDELHQDEYRSVISSTTCEKFPSSGTGGNELFEEKATRQCINTCAQTS